MSLHCVGFYTQGVFHAVCHEGVVDGGMEEPAKRTSRIDSNILTPMRGPGYWGQGWLLELVAMEIGP